MDFFIMIVRMARNVMLARCVDKEFDRTFKINRQRYGKNVEMICQIPSLRITG